MKTTHLPGVFTLIALASFFLSPAARAQEVHSNPAQPPAAGAEQQKDKDAEKEVTPIPAEKLVATHHELALGGKTLKYTATVGTLLIRDEEDKPYGSIFYVAYTLDGADAQTRPVSFFITVALDLLHYGCTWARFRRCASRPTAPTRPPDRRSS